MPFAESNHIGNDVSVRAFGVHEHARPAEFRLEALPASSVGLPETRGGNIASFRVDDVGSACLRLATEFLGPPRVIRQSAGGQLVLPRIVVRKIGSVAESDAGLGGLSRTG